MNGVEDYAGIAMTTVMCSFPGEIFNFIHLTLQGFGKDVAPQQSRYWGINFS